MKKTTEQWPVHALEELFTAINFPEYQREPTVWSRAAKQRLIDSMLRSFDIASIYLYIDDDGSIDCIDGRQRIGAIMSFLGRNPEDEDNGFEFRISNEIYEDEDHPFKSLDRKRYAELAEQAPTEPLANEFVNAFRDYPITVVQLEGSRQPEEFNLQFTRLNLGTILNSGEKLHAMVGELRDICFGDEGLGQHAFFEGTRIPTRRFSKEQVAAQLIAQLLSLSKGRGYARTRHFDLQRVFKEHTVLGDDEKAVVERVRALLDLLEAAFDELHVLRNRAITVSTVILGWEENVSSNDDARELARFIDGFVCRLQWQVKKRLNVDQEYRWLIEDFQRHLTQASVEKPAVEQRALILREEFARWRQNGKYRGDEDYQTRTGSDPATECRGGN